ncbi:hypothetical protein J3R30DRAFT_3285938, partial [Lentinula aciculospora]
RDVWETLFYHQICESLTWHVFEEPPTRVLDIGCGTGSWLLDCARVWRKCQFVGLDLVPIQPDLQRVGSADLAHRVTWVQENFLEGLPFPNEEFDFVHIKRISLGVPEDKWDFLLEEISRVMKPGAAFEMIEEDLMFPGGTIPSDDEDSGTEDSKSQSVDSAYFSDSETRRYSSSSSYFASGSETRNRNRPRSSSSAGSTSTATDIPKNQNAEKSVRRHNVSVFSKSIYSPRPLSTSTGSLTDLQSSLNFNPYARLNLVASPGPSTLPPKRPLSSGTHGYGTNSSIHLPSMSFSQSMHSVSSSSPHSPTLVPDVNSESGTISPENKLAHNPASPFLLRTLPKPPVNPRDHSVLEMIYNEMNAARFVNLSPLSLLPNLLGLYFKDLRTHPPVIFTFPPVPVVEHPYLRRSMSNASNSSSHSSSRLAGSPTPSSARTAYFEGVTDHWINMQQIVKRKSPYIIYDGSRLSALSPSTRASILSATKKSIPSPQKPAHDVRFRLPNTTMNIDLRSLNLHLALRVTEILGCSETMWEWVLEYQEQARNKKRSQETQARARSRSIGSTRPPSHDKQPAPESDNDRLKAVLVELTREEYDDMLRRFYLDMQDCMALPAALDERFGWNIPPAPPPAERKTFEAECEKFQKWEAEQYQRTSFKSLSGQASRLRPNSPVSIVHSSPTLDGLPALYTENLSMNGRSSVSSNFPKTHQGTHSVSSVASTAPSTAPSRRLSRSLRVFVAWKGFGAI